MQIVIFLVQCYCLFSQCITLLITSRRTAYLKTNGVYGGLR